MTKIGLMRKIAVIVEKIAPAKVQLNTVCRPPAERHAVSITFEQMFFLKAFFPDPVDIIGPSQLRHIIEARGNTPIDYNTITALIGRRPCSAKDVADGLGIHVNEALKHLNQLMTLGRAQTVQINGKLFYTGGSQK